MLSRLTLLAVTACVLVSSYSDLLAQHPVQAPPAAHRVKVAMAAIADSLAKLNPFGSKSAEVPDEEREEYEEFGEERDEETVAGGGRGFRQTDITRQLRVSNALKQYLVEQGVLSAEDAGLDSEEHTPALQALLDRPHIAVPPYLTDRSHPLPEYFISSSHNTYLIGEQLVGHSSAEAYRRALQTGARCVEIDAWDNEEDKEEPKVTHGYTLVSHISFRSVCEVILDVVDQEASEARDEQGYRAAPIMISLENHCSMYGQLRLVNIMMETWGDRLLSRAVREKGHSEQEGGEHVLLEELGSKIVLIVEFHLPEEVEEEIESQTSSSSSESSSDEEKKAAKREREEYKARKKAEKHAIIPELAELGVYAQSVKPVDNSWFDEPVMKNGPHHRLINVSEIQLQKLMPENNSKIATTNAEHLMRVFPKGTRITSKNLKPVPFWGSTGAQICALNWQSFGAPLQLNEALFSGTDGYVLKPAALCHGGDGKLNTGIRRRLRIHVAGATDVPVPKDGRDPDDIKPYLTCSMVEPENMSDGHSKRRTKPYKKGHSLSLHLLHREEEPVLTEPVWDEVLEWEYDDNEMIFLRMFVKSDDTLAKNPIMAVTAVRLMYVVRNEWNFIRMLDLKGKETKCSILVKFEIEDL